MKEYKHTQTGSSSGIGRRDFVKLGLMIGSGAFIDLHTSPAFAASIPAPAPRPSGEEIVWSNCWAHCLCGCALKVVLEDGKVKRIPKGIDLCFCEVGDEPSFYGNGTQIHQVVMNLSVNAVQVMGSRGLLEFGVRHAAALPEESANYGVSLQPDGAVICSRGRTLEKADAGYIVLIVKDSGPGMEEAVMRQMFSPLFSTKAPGEGTGLGLTIVDSIVGMHKGYILVRSAPGKGSEFSIYFPILSAPEE